MKLETALRNANRIAEKLRGLGGIISTPEGSHEAIRIKRAWVFGSTVKGSDSPHDLDVLLDVQVVGAYRPSKVKAIRGEKAPLGYAKTDKRYLRSTGIHTPIDSLKIATISLKKGMKMVSLHQLTIDGKIAFPRKMIYPKWEL